MLTAAETAVLVADAVGFGQRRRARWASSLAATGLAVAEVGEHELGQRPHVLVQTDHRAGAVGLTHVMAQQRAVPVDHVEGGGAELVPPPPSRPDPNGQAAASTGCRGSRSAPGCSPSVRPGQAPGTAPASPAAARRQPAHRPWSAPRRAGGGGHRSARRSGPDWPAPRRPSPRHRPCATSVARWCARSSPPRPCARHDSAGEIRDADLIMQRHRPEAGRDPPRPRMTHRRHPIKAPPLAQPTQAGGGLVFSPSIRCGWSSHSAIQPPPPARMRQHPEQQMRRPDHTPAPAKRIGQLEANPIGSPDRPDARSPTGPC